VEIHALISLFECVLEIHFSKKYLTGEYE